MAKASPFALQWPLAGLDRSKPYRAQPPFTAPDALNVRPSGTIEERARMGSRPGIGKAYQEPIGGGSPVRMLAGVNVVKTDGFVSWADHFVGTALGSIWTGYPTLPRVIEDGFAGVTFAATAGAIRDEFDPAVDTGQLYLIEMYLVPWYMNHCGIYRLFLMMDNLAPDPTQDCYVVELTMTGDAGAWSGQISEYIAGVNTNNWPFTNTPAIGSAKPGWFYAWMQGTNIRVYWQGIEAYGGGGQPFGPAVPAGERVGFQMTATYNPVTGHGTYEGICLIESFRAQYYIGEARQIRKELLVASAGGELWRERFLGHVQQVPTTLTLDSEHRLLAAEHLQKLYIADHGHPRAQGPDGICAGLLFDAVLVPDWTALNISAADDRITLYNVTGSVVAGIYDINAIAVGNIVLQTSAGTGTCSYRIERAPKVYHPDPNSLLLWTATAGTVPVGCKLITLYRDRLVLAGADDSPHLWYMSRQGDPLDFDYGASDLDKQRAIAGQLSDAGRVGEPINALVSFTDDYMLFGCKSSLWILRGDPAWSGIIDNLSRDVGVVDKDAWCRGPNGEFLFLSHDGIYFCPSGETPYPQLVSRDPLPMELRSLYGEDADISMSYDLYDRGIHIFLTQDSKASVLHWWFDWRNKGFWPVSLQTDQEPTASYAYYEYMSNKSRVLLGGRDGYIRIFDKNEDTDDGTAFDSYIQLGPIRLGDEYHAGILDELIGVLAQASGAVDWEVYVAETNEAVLDTATPAASGTWAKTLSHGLQRTTHVRAGGGSVMIKLSNNETMRWVIDRISGSRRITARQRLL